MTNQNLTYEHRYLQNYSKCPKCMSDDGIEGGSVEIDAGTATQECWCGECGAEWTDIYKLSGLADCEGFDPQSPICAGSVIHGTLRPQDLIPAFLTALEQADPAVHAQILVNAVFGVVPAYAQEDEDADWWTDCAPDWIEQLTEALDACAPEGYYFGAHPGDGSDFGFWKEED